MSFKIRTGVIQAGHSDSCLPKLLFYVLPGST